ncbi:MAG TPA: flagellar assembly protein FliW [Acidimicrobiales bacterium]|nr:flagellar assembly protein FliW [Acidimicrobiales bacterium]
MSPVTNLPSDAESTPAIVEFPDGLPGFPEARRFSLESLEEGLAPFCAMRSLDVPGLQFIVVPPGGIFADYVIDVPEDDVERLGLTTSDDALVLVIVTVAQPPTANLLGPVVVNRHTGWARQVVLVGSGYEVRTPIPGA